MASIETGQRCVDFKKTTPICGNCDYENRVRNEAKGWTERRCALHGWFVLMSSTCNDHKYRPKGANNVTA